MNKTQIEAIKRLDPNGDDGSVQNILLNTNLAETPSYDVLMAICSCLMENKKQLVEEIRIMLRFLKTMGCTQVKSFLDKEKEK